MVVFKSLSFIAIVTNLRRHLRITKPFLTVKVLKHLDGRAHVGRQPSDSLTVARYAAGSTGLPIDHVGEN